MKKRLLNFTAIFLLILFTSCAKKVCYDCTKTIGGVAGNFVAETKTVTSETKAKELESSSSGTTVWKCVKKQ